MSAPLAMRGTPNAVPAVSRQLALLPLPPRAQAPAQPLQARKANGLLQRTSDLYASYWGDFCTHCAENGYEPLPASPQAIAQYLESRLEAGDAGGSLKNRRAAISRAHRNFGLDDDHNPALSHYVRRAYYQLRKRAKGRERKADLHTGALRQVLDSMPPDDLRSMRDRALFLVGFAGALERRQLALLEVRHLEFLGLRALQVRLPATFVGDTREGKTVLIPAGQNRETCPVRALRAWLNAADIQAGAVFRQIDRYNNVRASALVPQGTTKILQDRCTAAGLNGKAYGFFSLRGGFIVSAAANGVALDAVAAGARIKNAEDILDRFQTGAGFRTLAASHLGL